MKLQISNPKTPNPIPSSPASPPAPDPDLTSRRRLHLVLTSRCPDLTSRRHLTSRSPDLTSRLPPSAAPSRFDYTFSLFYSQNTDHHTLSSSRQVAKLESAYMYYDNGLTQIQIIPLEEVFEISKMLRAVIARFRNLLAQVWVPCKRDVVASNIDEEVLSIFDMSMPCESYPEMLRFRRHCREHLLKKGQGIAGKAAIACRPCFCSDISKLSTTDYPLTHYAQMSGLTSSFAVYLQSASPGNTNCYVVELFMLPEPDDYDSQVPRSLLGSILITTRRLFTSFKLSSGRDEISVEIINFLMNGERESNPCQTSSLLVL